MAAAAAWRQAAYGEESKSVSWRSGSVAAAK